MEEYFEYELLTVYRSKDRPGGFVFWLADELDVCHQVVPAQTVGEVIEFLRTNIVGQYMLGSLRIVKHVAGWLEISFATWRDPTPSQYVPEHLCEKLLVMMLSVVTH